MIDGQMVSHEFDWNSQSRQSAIQTAPPSQHQRSKKSLLAFSSDLLLLQGRILLAVLTYYLLVSQLAPTFAFIVTMPTKTKPATRRRGATTGAGGSRVRTKQQQYRICDSSSDEEDEEPSENLNSNRSSSSDDSSKDGKEGAASKVGGVLASLNNQLPRHKKRTTRSARKMAKGSGRTTRTSGASIEGDGSGGSSSSASQAKGKEDDSSQLKAAHLKTPEPKNGRSRRTTTNTKTMTMTVMTPPPTSVVVKHGNRAGETVMSPPTSENRRAYQRRVNNSNKNNNGSRQDDGVSAISEYGSVASDDEEEESKAEKILGSADHGEDDSDTAKEKNPMDAIMSDGNSRSSVESAASESSSEEGGVDNDDDDGDTHNQREDEEEDNEDSSEEEYEFEDDEFVPEEDGGDEDYSDSSLDDFIVDETPRKSVRLSTRKAKQKLSPEEKIEITNPLSVQESSPISSEESPPSHQDEEDLYGNSIEPDEEEKPANTDTFTPGPSTPERSPTSSDCDETLIEETPMKNSLPRRALDFQSPEPEMAVVVDEDDDASMDDAVIAVVVDDVNEYKVEEVVYEMEEIELSQGAIFDDEDGHQSIEQHEDTYQALVKESVEKQHEAVEVVEAVTENESHATDHGNPKKKSECGEKPFAKNGSVCNDELREMWLSLQAASPLSSTKQLEEPTHSPLEDKITKESQVVNNYNCHTITIESQSSSEKVQTKKIITSYRAEGAIKRGKWKLGAKIGVGSFGEVFVGMNTKSGVLMAVKRFHMQGAEKSDIRREVELLRSLKHENIVRYLGAEMDKSLLHIFQEWVPGGSVSSLLKKFGPFSLEVIQSYLSQTISGLVYLHQNDIMHRDIKGSNVLVNDYGVVKLADFGASKKIASLEDNLMMSMTVRGSPYFMAPEVFEEKYSAKADIWSVGGLAFQMATGMPPWKEKGFSNPISLFNHIKRQTGPPRMEHPGSESFTNRQQTMWHTFKDMVGKCFYQDPSTRPSVTQLQKDAFFLSVHDCDDDETSQCLGLFSPRNGGLGETFPTSPTLVSPPLASRSIQRTETQATPSPNPKPAREALSRSKSVVQWKTSFLSPPRQKRNSERGSPSPCKSSPAPPSPSPDSREWPTWARDQLKKQPRKLPMNTPHKEVQDLQTMLDSLAFSEDGNSFQTNNYQKKGRMTPTNTTTIGTTSDKSKLVGLALLEENEAEDDVDSQATFEI